jgi:prevent-host-death family protein
MAKGTWRKMIQVPLSKMKDSLSEFIREAGKEEVVVTVQGRPAAVIIGFHDEDDWLECRLLNDGDFFARMA